jgi:ribulose-5-phosphate 4-epimerase/fuculose-1-phosphate aldolase
MNDVIRKSRINHDVMRKARVDLAAAFRLAERFNLHEGVCNHFSLAAPDAEGQFLINPQGLHWSEITASSLILIDTSGNVLEGELPAEPTAFYIHSAIHKHAPQARCIMHTHMPYATALTAVDDGELAPIHQSSLMFHNQIAYDDEYHGLVLDSEEGDRIATALGNKAILFLSNHGVIVTGTTVAETFDKLYYLERACMMQVIAMSTGRHRRRIDDDVAERTAQQMSEDTLQARLHFAALKRMLNREAPDYRD